MQSIPTRTFLVAVFSGYMSPKYAVHGRFSQKSDVYSFGVLLLEIICSKRNDYFYQSDGGEDLASYAWKHWRDDMTLEILDTALGESIREAKFSDAYRSAYYVFRKIQLIDRPWRT